MDTVGKTIRASLFAKDHANKESLPLRFGVHFPSDCALELSNVKDFGSDSRRSDRFHVEADFQGNNGRMHSGHFVLAKRDFVVVTVWRVAGDVDVEFYLSETMKNLSRDGCLTVRDLLDMHPRYLKGEVNTAAKLIKFLSERGSAADRVKYCNAMEEAKMQSERFQRERDEANQKAEHEKALRREAEERVQAERTQREIVQAQLDELRNQLEENATHASVQKNGPEYNRPLVVLSKWRSRTATAEYENALVEANILSAESNGSKIRLAFSDRKGEAKTVVDFGRKGLVQEVLLHLKKHENNRAKFILTWKPGGEVMLASDTMVWREHKSKWGA